MKIVPMSLLKAGQAEAGGDVLPLALVSLDSDESRRKLLRHRDLPSDWVEHYWPGSDFRGVTDAHLTEHVDPVMPQKLYGRRLRAGEVGCAKSHLEALNWLASSSCSMAVMLEDDIIPNVPDLPQAIRDLAHAVRPLAERGCAFLLHLGARPEHVRLTPRLKVRGTSPPVDKLYLQKGPTYIWRTHAYIISREAALRMVKDEPLIKYVADDWHRRHANGIFDEVFFTSPQIIKQDDDIPSTIERGEVVEGVQTPPLTLRDLRPLVAARLMQSFPYQIDLKRI